MRKRVYFDIFDGPGWPSPVQLQRYFLAAPGQRWLFESRNDCIADAMRNGYLSQAALPRRLSPGRSTLVARCPSHHHAYQLPY